MSAFPFPKLLEFLEKESDQVEFMKVCAEVGIDEMDLELGKLLLALQIYKAYYATVPREIKASHRLALEEMHGLRDEMRAMIEAAIRRTAEIEQWAAQIKQAVMSVRPEAVAHHLHKRLVDDTLASIGGAMQVLTAAYGRIDTATGKLNQASAAAEASIYEWQILNARKVWQNAFALGFAVAFVICLGAWALGHL
jgi:hypothetical protein